MEGNSMEKVVYHSGTLIYVSPCRLHSGNEANQMW